jgi:3-phenylpropionate/trans-cinnamate dioxygenase ferredoxin subunit
MPAPARVLLGKSDLGEGELRGFEVGPERFVLVSRLNGHLYAIDDWCNHAGCLLSGGRLEGQVVICPCHEIGFDLVSGRNVTDPKLCDDQRRHRVVEQDGQLWLLPDP